MGQSKHLGKMNNFACLMKQLTTLYIPSYYLSPLFLVIISQSKMHVIKEYILKSFTTHNEITNSR